MAAQMATIKKARGRLLVNHIFYATLVLSTPFEIDNSIPTAATDMRVIKYNERFIDSLSTDVVMFVIVHEVMHIMFKHGLRKGWRKHGRWNIACISDDSLILMADGSEVPASQVRAGDFLWSPDGPNKVLEVLDRGEREVVHLTHSEGECFVTPDHKFLTDEGFMDADAKGSGLRQDLHRVPRGAGLYLGESQNYVDQGPDGGYEGGVSQRRTVHVEARTDGGSLHTQTRGDHDSFVVIDPRVGLSRGHRGWRRDHHDYLQGSLPQTVDDDLEYIVSVEGLAEGARVPTSHELEYIAEVVLAAALGGDVSGQTDSAHSPIHGYQSEALRSDLGVHLATASAVQEAATNGSYARDCRDLSLVERVEVNVRRTGTTRHVIDFVTTHHVVVVGGLLSHNCDHAINLILKKGGFTIWSQCYCDPRFEGMSAEQIYDILEDENQQGKGPSAPGQDDGPDGGFGGSDLQDPPDIDPVAVAKLEQGIQQRLAQAVAMARMAGQMPAGLDLIVDGLLHPPQPWQEHLREYMTAVRQEDETWSRRNRRFSEIVLPTRWSEGMGEMITVGDTSGSMMMDKVFAQIALELNEIVEQVKPERVRVIWADDEECSHMEVFEPGEEITLHPKGGGGTDMRKALRFVEQFEPAVVLLITDGYTPWPDKPTPYPLIIACTTKVKCPDYANVIRLRM